jgi:two-component system copper resistance phosphate regulon response regulator CusR
VKILYVEDDPSALEYVRKGLSEHGFVTDLASTGEVGLKLALDGSYDLLILDVMLPRLEGFELLRELRAQQIRTPVLFLSARGDVSDRIRGLELGADDYLTKPFAFAELVARISAIIRRAGGVPAGGRLQVGDLVLDLKKHKVTRGKRRIDLTPTEFSLLHYLMRYPGHVLSRTMIIEEVWGYGFESCSNCIEVHVNRLRKKVDHGMPFRLLHTVKGVGYVLEDRRLVEAGSHADADRGV